MPLGKKCKNLHTNLKVVFEIEHRASTIIKYVLISTQILLSLLQYDYYTIVYNIIDCFLNSQQTSLVAHLGLHKIFCNNSESFKCSPWAVTVALWTKFKTQAYLTLFFRYIKINNIIINEYYAAAIDIYVFRCAYFISTNWQQLNL